MRSKFYSLMFSLFLVGLGSAVFFFEVSDYTVDNGRIDTSDYTVISNTYSLNDIQRITMDSYATIVIDDLQVGIRVDIRYNDKVTTLVGESYTYFYDCPTIGETINCESELSKKGLHVSYNFPGNKFSLKEVVNIMVENAKNKVIINPYELIRPLITITVNTENAKLLNKQ
jgi:hypothetical protein